MPLSNKIIWINKKMKIDDVHLSILLVYIYIRFCGNFKSPQLFDVRRTAVIWYTFSFDTENCVVFFNAKLKNQLDKKKCA